MKQFSIEEYIKNPNRKVITRDGRNVTIHCTNYQGTFPVIAEVEGLDYSMAFMDDGVYHCIESSIYDLFFAPEKHEGWVNIFKNDDGENYATYSIYKSKEEAEEDGKQYSGYITSIEIKWEEDL